jgi:hypothetical protein
MDRLEPEAGMLRIGGKEPVGVACLALHTLGQDLERFAKPLGGA